MGDRDTRLDYQLGKCFNCGSNDVTINAPLYCSPQCRQSAELVRYVRARRRECRDREPEIVEAIRTRMAMVLGGGYPEQQRRVPEETRRLVFERANGHCQECGRVLIFGQSAEDPDSIATIQHVSGSSNELDNLLAFCRRCNLADAQSRFVPVGAGSEEAQLAIDLQSRWMPEEPLRVCDDDTRWSGIWRQLTREAKEVLRLDAEIAASADDRDLPGFKGWTEQGTPIQEF